MKKLILSLAAAFLAVTTVQAGVKEFYIGSGKNEIGTVSKVLADSSVVIGGYIWDYVQGQVGNNVANAKMLVLRISPSGTIMWQQSWGLPGNNFINDLIIARNGDIIAVGTVGRDASTHHNTAAIYRIDPATGLNITESYIADTAVSTNLGGEVFNSVAELANGDIVAVGAGDQRPNYSGGLISVYNSALVNRYYTRIDQSTSSDEFTGIVANQDTVYLCGYQFNGNLHKATLTKYVPGTTLLPGNLIWEKQYDFSVGTLHNSVNSKIQLINNRLVIDGWLSTDCCAQSDEKQYILRTDLAGVSPNVKVIENGKNWANNFRTFAMSDDDVYVVECPAPTFVDPLWNGNTTTVNGIVSHISSLNSSSFAFTKRFTLHGNHSLLGLDQRYTGLVMVGAASDDAAHNFAGKDIYYVKTDMNVVPEQLDCSVIDTQYTMDEPAVTSPKLVDSRHTFVNIPLFSVAQEATNLAVRNVCTDDSNHNGGDCPDGCYWKLNGNSAVTASNFLGPINAADLIIKTTNTERARILKTGEVGIHVSAPAANLDVECAPAGYPSGLRFENLPPTEEPFPMVVVDPAGYVYQFRGTIHQYPIANPGGNGGSGSGTMQQQIDMLKEQLRVLSDYVTKLNGGSMNAGLAGQVDNSTMSVYPNPSNGKLNVQYNIAGQFKYAGIVITDMKGQKIFEQQVATPSGTAMLTIPSSVTASEVLCTLYADDKAIGSQKILLYKK